MRQFSARIIQEIGEKIDPNDIVFTTFSSLSYPSSQKARFSSMAVMGVGLSCFGARYYDSELGIWTATDPMDEYWSSYTYVGGNPLSFVDPKGLDTYLILHGAGYLNTDAQGQSHDVGDRFMLSAEARADQIRNSAEFDPEKDDVFVVPAFSTKAFVDAVNASYWSGDIVLLASYSHGYSGGISLGGESGNMAQRWDYDLREINPTTLLQLDPGKFALAATIDVNACNVGKSFAQDMANYLNRPVSAFMGPAQWPNRTDNSRMVPANPRTGAKRTFTPSQ